MTGTEDTAERQVPQGLQEAMAPALETLARQWAVLLTIYKRDGAPVGTAVSVVVRGTVPY